MFPVGDRQWIPLLVALLMLTAAPARASSGFRVIVNKENPVSTLTPERAARIFMKKEAHWEDGQEISPVDLRASSLARRRFTREIYGRSVSAIRSYWQKRIFTGRGTPPPEKASDGEVVSFVNATPGAIGYVSPAAAVATVKVLRIER